MTMKKIVEEMAPEKKWSASIVTERDGFVKTIQKMHGTFEIPNAAGERAFLAFVISQILLGIVATPSFAIFTMEVI